MVRRKYITRKRKSTALFVYYITKDWVYHYLKLRQFERFYQSFGMSNVLSYAADFDVFKVAPNCINEKGIHIFSINKLIFSFFRTKSVYNYNNTVGVALRKSKIKNSKQTFIQTDSLQTLSGSNLAYPAAISIDNHEYHPTTQLITKNQNLQTLQTLKLLQFNSTLKFIQTYNRILVLLSINHIF